MRSQDAEQRAGRAAVAAVTEGAGRRGASPPRRIRLSRSAGWRKPSGAVVVARPTRWGNPFRVGSAYMWLAGEEDRTWPVPTSRQPGDHPDGVRVVRCPDTATAVRWFRFWAQGDYATQARRLLRGHDLACWCPLDQPCHADVLLELANR
ncbi:DUF4326 domain-containing protein [Geodermatophilus maliterrae]|uniref:DUF4326 domain-containing protein n=1 Tax=Geodermatophilus maliterrae TaxID=3162531 RepID=A0ABV3XB52_9ACTN